MCLIWVLSKKFIKMMVNEQFYNYFNLKPDERAWNRRGSTRTINSNTPYAGLTPLQINIPLLYFSLIKPWIVFLIRFAANSPKCF